MKIEKENLSSAFNSLLDSIEEKEELTFKIVPGDGFFMLDKNEGEPGYEVDFPDFVLISFSKYNENDDCVENLIFKNVIPLKQLFKNHYVDILSGSWLHKECELELFEKILENRCFNEKIEDEYECAEDVIYKFEAHGVLLHPAIYRKYKK